MHQNKLKVRHQRRLSHKPRSFCSSCPCLQLNLKGVLLSITFLLRSSFSLHLSDTLCQCLSLFSISLYLSVSLCVVRLCPSLFLLRLSLIVCHCLAISHRITISLSLFLLSASFYRKQSRNSTKRFLLTRRAARALSTKACSLFARATSKRALLSLTRPWNLTQNARRCVVHHSAQAKTYRNRIALYPTIFQRRLIFCREI